MLAPGKIHGEFVRRLFFVISAFLVAGCAVLAYRQFHGLSQLQLKLADWDKGPGSAELFTSAYVEALRFESTLLQESANAAPDLRRIQARGEIFASRVELLGGMPAVTESLPEFPAFYADAMPIVDGLEDQFKGTAAEGRGALCREIASHVGKLGVTLVAMRDRASQLAYLSINHQRAAYSEGIRDGVFWMVTHCFVTLTFAGLTALQFARLSKREKDLRQLADNLAEARVQADAANRAKGEFLANMSHEIRTPMNGVVGMGDILATTPLNDTQRNYVETIRTSSQALLTVINDILDFSKIEAGKLEIESIPFDLGETVERAVTILAPRAQEKNLELVAAYPPAGPHHFMGDPARILQVLVNLGSNAIKFTDRGEIVIQVRPTINADHTHVRIEVTDTGIGICEAVRQKLFQPFSQADASMSKKYGGTGLGLAITKQLVELMGGEVGVDSRPNQGSTFWVHLKLPQAPAKSPPTATQALHGVRTLLVLANRTQAQECSAQLSSWGMACEQAATPAEAIERMAQAPALPIQLLLIEAAFIDEALHAPFVSALRDGRARTGCRVVIVTDLLRDAAPGADADVRLVKPLTRTKLYTSACEALASRGPGGADLGIKTVSTQAPVSTYAEFGWKVLVAEDNPVNRRVAKAQLKNLGIKPEFAENGRIAVELAEQHDYDLIFMDCQMPELDGFQTTERIRQLRNRSAQAKIIAVTGNALAGDRERCLAAGMDDYLTKPVQSRTLAAAIDRHMLGRN